MGRQCRFIKEFILKSGTSHLLSTPAMASPSLLHSDNKSCNLCFHSLSFIPDSVFQIDFAAFALFCKAPTLDVLSCGIVNLRSLERSLKKEQLPRAGSIGTGVRGFGMRSADLKLRSEIPICAAISQPASGNGIISVRQGRASQSCFARTSSISCCSPGGEHLGGFRRPIWGQGYARG